VKIAYETFGDAANPPVLLVHGFASNRSANWIRARWPQPLLDAGFRGVAIDLRGHGESERPRRLDSYGVPRFHGDFIAVLDELGIESAHVLGYSLGARLSWEFALRHMRRVRSLVLGGTPLGGSFPGFEHERARAHLRERPSMGAAADDSTARYVAMARGIPGNDPHALIRVAEALRRRPFAARDRVPVQQMLLVAGSEDPLAHDSAQLADELPNARYIELPGRNHITAVTSRLFKEQTFAFLREQEDLRASAA
jgi:pimeloyl-ACP methyl ester carboxylesterase